MKHKTVFRLAIRAIGVLLIAEGVPSILGALGQALWLLTPSSNAFSTTPFFVNLPWFISSLARSLVGLYLFFGGEWIVNRAIPSNRPYCHECGYDLSGLAADGVCPECGTQFRHEH